MTTHPDSRQRMSTRLKLTLFVLLGAQFMLSVDFSILNVALPQIGSGIGMSSEDLPWVASAYALPAAGFTLLFGRIADLFGRRRLFLAGIVLLTVASVLGGVADDPGLLLTARVLQGLSTAMAAPAALSLLTTSFSEGAMRERVLGLNGALLSGGFTVGALVGGTLVGLLSWRWAFLINVPVALVILVATPRLIEDSRAPEKVRLDVPGAVTVTAGLLAFVYGVIDKSILISAVGVLLLGVFWLIELRSPAPLASVRILKRPSVKWGNFAGLVVFSMESALIFLMTLYLQDVLDFAPLTTGLIFGVPGLAAVAAGVVAGRAIGRFGTRNVLAVGLAVQGLATAPLVLVGSDRVMLAVALPALFISFFGHVTSIVAYTVTATSGLPDSEQGLATGLAALSQQVAVTIGIPILSAVAATRSVQLDGIHLALGVDVAVTLVAVGLLWVGLRNRSGAASPAAQEPPVEVGERAASH